MAQHNGSLAVNGITDEELIKILEIKKKHEKVFFFSPQQLQAQQNPNGSQFYNNATFNWNGDEGLFAVHKLIGELLKVDEKGVAAGQ